MSPALVHTYAPRGGCRALFACREAEVLLSGPAGTGKSRACLEKLLAVALANPGMRGLVVRKTAESLTTTALVTWREHVATEALATGLCHFYGGSAQEPPQYRLSNGSRIMIGGMNKPSRIMSTEYDMVYAQEAVELVPADWEALVSRLRNGKVGFQQLIADTNPDAPTHWLNQRCNAGTTARIESRHTDNPRYYTEMPALDRAGQEYALTAEGAAYMAKLDRLTGVRRYRLRDGIWAAAEGIIYEEFDPAIHMIDPFPIPEEWPRVWTVDFGFRHPFVCQMWATDGDGRAYRYRELYGTGRTVEDWAEKILACVRTPADPGTVEAEADWEKPALWRWTEPRPTAIVCDHDAEGRAVLARKLGLPTRPAHKKVREGIDAVQQRLKDRGLFVIRGALVGADSALAENMKPTCLEEELPAYRWDKDKEAPVKEDDDGCDAMRYLVAHLDLATRSSVRFW